MKVAKKLKITKYCWICPKESKVGSKNFNNSSNIIRMNDERTQHRAGCAKKRNGIDPKGERKLNSYADEDLARE